MRLLGPWFGTGTDRGLALLFTVAGLVGLTVTLLAMRSSSYRLLSEKYQRQSLDGGHEHERFAAQPEQVARAQAGE